MKKNLFKKVTASVLALTMVCGMAGVAEAATHAANGANVAAGCSWSSFSVCTREDGGEWEDALKGIRTDDYPDGQTKGVDYATEGWLDTTYEGDGIRWYIANTGWDGEYDPNGNLVGDNPWGLTLTMSDIPVEFGRKYTISFKIKSTLQVTGTDDEGNATETLTKHMLFKAYDPNSNGEPGVEFDSISGATTGGYITLDYVAPSADEWQTVTAQITIPDKKSYGGETLGIKFAAGAMMVSYPDEIALSGSIYISDFKVTAGTQYTVTLTNGSKTETQYVNAGSTATYSVLGKKGYTLTGYKDKSTGKMYNFSSAVNSDLTLEAVYTKTKAPAKVKIKSVQSPRKKRIAVTLKKAKNASGYQIQYSTKKNMKKVKKTSTTKTKCTIKKLKSGSVVYVKARGYALDSMDKKIYGKFSKKKKAFVK